MMIAIRRGLWYHKLTCQGDGVFCLKRQKPTLLMLDHNRIPEGFPFRARFVKGTSPFTLAGRAQAYQFKTGPEWYKETAMATSKLQERVGELLRQYLPKFTIVENLRPEWLIDNEGARLELDFFIDELSIAVEVQGEQHYEYVEHFHKTYVNFLRQQQRDEFKRDICKKNGIWLIEIADSLDADTIIPQLRPQSLLCYENEAAANFHRKQAIAMVRAWTVVKSSPEYARVKKAGGKSKKYKTKRDKEVDPEKKNQYEKKLRRAATSFHAKNDNLYRKLVDTYIQYMSEG